MPRQPDSALAAIKQATDIVALVGEYLPLHRVGGKFKALCPFHDDHNPSLELNSERQSFKCWSCGAGGDVFDFVKDFERIDFSEALRMLAERAGITLEKPDAKASPGGPSKTDLLAACAWAEGVFSDALTESSEGRTYARDRGITEESLARFHLGFAPDQRDWISSKARMSGFSMEVLERAGLVARNEETNILRDRFRGRLIFPIRDGRGRPIAFGGRILPTSEKRMADAGMGVAKYLNSPETPLFQKRKTLYASDLARASARSEGWVAVVEGYTDVIAAHQAGLTNFVGTLGTALGDDHVLELRRLADCVVLVFDGDEAGQKAADRSLELFLGHEVDVRVLTLPEGLDPADFLEKHGAQAFRTLVDRAVDPLEFILARASERFDLGSSEGARQAAEWIVPIVAKVPRHGRGGLDLKVAKALDTMSRRLGIPVNDLKRRLREQSRPRAIRPTTTTEDPAPPIRPESLDPLDRELVQIALNAPEAVDALHRTLAADDLRDPPLRAILQALYDRLSARETPEFSAAAPSLSEQERALAAGLLLPFDRSPMPDAMQPAPWTERLVGALARLDLRRWQDRLRDLEGALREIDPISQSADRQALRAEYLSHLSRRPDSKKR